MIAPWASWIDGLTATLSQSSHIKGKPSHKIVSDGKHLQSYMPSRVGSILTDFCSSQFALQHDPSRCRWLGCTRW